MDPTIQILDASTLTKYVTELPRPIKLKPNKCHKQPRYTITMNQADHILHPDLPPTTLWTYNGLLAPLLIENERYHAIQVKWVSELPTIHLLQSYIDHTLLGA